MGPVVVLYPLAPHINLITALDWREIATAISRWPRTKDTIKPLRG